MNLVIVILLFIVFLVPLWLLFGRGETSEQVISETQTKRPDTPDAKLPPEADLPENRELARSNEFEKEYREELTRIGEDFSLPFSNSSIIDPDSPFSIYRRTLDNAQYYLERGDLDTARDLYSGLLQRISDSEIRHKIEDNIDYLNNYQQIAANRQREQKLKTAAGDNEIRVTMGGQEFVPENIKIDITPPTVQPKIDMDELIQSLTGHVAKISPAIKDSNERISELLEYRDELSKVKDEIQSFYDIREESQRIREQRIDEDLKRINELREQIERENDEREKNIEIDALRREIDTLKNEQSRQVYTQQEILSMREQMQSLKEELALSARAQGDISQLQETIQTLRKELAGKQENEGDIQLLTQQITSLSGQLQGSMAADEAKKLQSHLERLQQKLEGSTDQSNEISELKNQVQRLTEHIAMNAQPTSSDISGIQEEIKELGRRLQERESTHSEIRDLHTQIHELKGELQEKEKKASELSDLKTQIQSLQHELNFQKSRADEVKELKEKIGKLESERLDNLKQQSETENKVLREQIDALKNELTQTRKQSVRDEDLARLKDAISELEKKSSDRMLNTQQLEKLRNEVRSLAKDAALSSEMEAKIDRLVKEGLTALPAGSAGAPQIESLTQQIESLKNDLRQAQISQEIQTAHVTQALPEGFADFPPAPAQKAEPQKKEEVTPKAKPEIKEHGKPEEQGPSADSNLNVTPKKEEDTKEDFETLRDHLQGPQFEEPSEDEILEKILTDAGKKEEREYEIRGTEDSTDVSDDFDISKLFAPSSNIDPGEEEFYNQFMEKNRPRVKKELPILQVSYRFDKLPELSSLSKESNIIESTFYRYKHLLEKANEHIKRRQVNDALNYFETVLAQDIPEEFKKMIRQNIQDLNDYLEKYMLNM